eukprot:TRINITY_DN721_c0_g1_i1.p2 TRINITY_DN721_c0_g1~~TRINITY_DN721_c0_g1_i1.p2  ORF type:complete len:90 (+),score=19.08 TRINITY_DN721_c0_g1_i1:158-427(+)
MSHNFTVLKCETETIVRESGVTAQSLTIPRCPFSVLTHLAVAISHSLSDLSLDADITVEPSEVTTQEFTSHVLCVDTGRSSETAKAHRG